MRTLGSNKAISNLEEGVVSFESASGTLTIGGVLRKSFIMFALAIISGIVSYVSFINQPELIYPLFMASSFATFILIIAIMWFNKANAVTTNLYAVAQGIMLGGIALILNVMAYLDPIYEGIFGTAVILTAALTLGLLLMYRIGLIRTSERLNAFMAMLIFGVIIISLFAMIGRLFGGSLYNTLYGVGPIAIVFTLVYLLIWTYYLLQTFEQIEGAANMGLPAKAEWYLGFSLFWVIIEILWTLIRLLIQLARYFGDN